MDFAGSVIPGCLWVGAKGLDMFPRSSLVWYLAEGAWSYNWAGHLVTPLSCPFFLSFSSTFWGPGERAQVFTKPMGGLQTSRAWMEDLLCMRLQKAKRAEETSWTPPYSSLACTQSTQSLLVEASGVRARARSVGQNSQTTVQENLGNKQVLGTHTP